MAITKPRLPIQALRPKDVNRANKSATPVVSRGDGPPLLGKSLKTPIRRFFFRFETHKSDTSGAGSKRSRVDEHDNDTGFTLDPLVHTPPLSSDVATSPITELDTPDAEQHTYNAQFPGQQYTPLVPCMALQNSDNSVDAVVISTLLKLPFCCHEDLLTMSPTRIVEVAQEMNKRLPEVLKIELTEPHDHNGIRREVERLVGIVKSINGVSVPGAPLKRAKSRGRRELGDIEFLDHSDLGAISPPTSPLAIISETRGRRRFGQGSFKAVMSPTKLPMLQEEDEDGYDEAGKHDAGMALLDDANNSLDEDVFRVAKKRRTSVSSTEVEMITPTIRHIKAPLMLTKLYDVNDTSPTPPRIVKNRPIRKIMLDDPSATSPKSSRVIIKTTVIDRSLANTRARYRSSSKFTHTQNTLKDDLFGGPLHTSTPKLAQIEREHWALGMKAAVPPIPKVRRSKRGKAMDVSPDWDVGASRIPSCRKGRMSDFMLVDINGRKESDGNQIF